MSLTVTMQYVGCWRYPSGTKTLLRAFGILSVAGALVACGSMNRLRTSQGVEVKMLVGSALGGFCNDAASQLNQSKPTLASGEPFYLTCEALGSGDVVTQMVSLGEQLRDGILPADAPEFPSLISVDGEIYQSILIDRFEILFPGQSYIPAITDAPLIATSPMVFMTSAELAPGLRNTADLFQSLVTAQNHQDIDPASPPFEIHYVHTAPSRSNSGLQTLVAQYASVSGKRPEALTLEDVESFAPAIRQIQQKITRYGVSTQALAEAMVQNGLFWASVGSVYESSVIAANTNLQPGQMRYEAVYPRATFSSNMRAIAPTAPWVSEVEQEAVQLVIEYLQLPSTQQIATNLGLRPGTPGVPLGSKFTPAYGVDPNANYDSYRAPSAVVAEAMIVAWETIAKKPSLVAVVIDSSGSMAGDKMPSVQNTLLTYINTLGVNDQIALFDFDDQLRPPVLISGTPDGRNQGIEFISNLQVGGGTALYDATRYAQAWLSGNLRAGAINAVLVLTDGTDTDSSLSLEALNQQLQNTGFESDARIAVFTVGYGQDGDFSPEALEAIAQANGGYYQKGDPRTIAEVMATLQLEF